MDQCDPEIWVGEAYGNVSFVDRKMLPDYNM